MRYLHALILLLLLLPAIPARADVCYGVGASSSASITGIDGVCKAITNNDPFTVCTFAQTTANQWQSFYNSPPGGVSIGNCTCSSPCGTLSQGGTCTVWNTTQSCGGCSSANITCNNGSDSGGNGWTATSCNNNVCASCSTPCGTIGSGQTCTVWNTTGSCGGCSSATITCNNGSTSGGNGWTATSCNNSSCAGCSATNTSWGSGCSGSVGALSSGNQETVNNSASGYTGSETASCSNGSWSYSNASCSSSGVSCNLPWGGSVPSGTTRQATSYYAKRSAWNYCGDYCSDEIIDVTCNNGTLTCSDLYDGDISCSTYYSTCGNVTCFLPDARITMADGSEKPVAELKPGDLVRGATRINRVIRIAIHQTTETIYGFNHGPAFVTSGHPFKTLKGWKAIDPALTPTEGHDIKVTKLKPGDIILMLDGKSLTVTSIDAHRMGSNLVYNPVLDGDHTYYSDGYLVHNKAQCP